MAKELPYFKFEPNAWENGNIQICSREDKGLFLDVCSMYWSRLGVLPFKLAVQKLCGGNSTAFDSLINESIFQVIDDMIYIEFLNEQLQEFEDLSETNRKNALDGWKKRKESKNKSERNATASKSQSENDAIREDKIIEDKRKEKTLMSEANASDLTENNFKYFKISKGFYDLFKINSSEVLKVNWKHLEKVKANSFTDNIRLAIEQDKRTEDEMRDVYNFIKSDDFWMKNIQSSKSLRENFDQLITKARNPSKKQKPDQPEKIVYKGILSNVSRN